MTPRTHTPARMHPPPIPWRHRHPALMRMLWGVPILLLILLVYRSIDDVNFERRVRHAEAILLGQESDDPLRAAATLHHLAIWGGEGYCEERSPRRTAFLRGTAIPALRAGLRSDDSTIRRYCAEAIGSLRGGEALEALPELTALALDWKAGEQATRAASRALGRLGPKAVDALVQGMEAPDTETRVQCMDAFVEQGPDVVVAKMELLVKFLSDEAAEVRGAAMRVLGSAGERARPALPAMLPLLSDPDHGVRFMTVCAVAAVGSDPSILQALIHVGENDKAENVRGGVAFVLGRMHLANPAEVAPILTALLHDKSPSVQRHAAWAMAKLGLTHSTAADTGR